MGFLPFKDQGKRVISLVSKGHTLAKMRIEMAHRVLCCVRSVFVEIIGGGEDEKLIVYIYVQELSLTLSFILFQIIGFYCFSLNPLPRISLSTSFLSLFLIALRIGVELPFCSSTSHQDQVTISVLSSTYICVCVFMYRLAFRSLFLLLYFSNLDLLLVNDFYE